MIVDIYDVTSTPRYYRGQTVGKDEFELSNSLKLPEILIIPSERQGDHVNRAPYFQDINHPILDDIYLGDMTFNYDCCHCIVDDVLTEEEGHRIYVRTYFECLKKFLKREITGWQEADRNVLVVPDSFKREQQEHLLQDCGMPRSDNKTMLLWRSVAMCLGAKKQLKARGIRKGDRVAIIDVLPPGLESDTYTFSMSILTMALHSEEKVLVPKRKVYPRDEETNESYPYSKHPMDMIHGAHQDELWQFWKNTVRSAGTCVIPKRSQWTRFSPRIEAVFNVSNLVDIDYVLIDKDVNSDIQLPASIRHVLNDSDLLPMGAGCFINCSEHNLPTYLDECEPLYFIVQRNEDIVPISLFGSLAECEGGRTIHGRINKDYFLQKDNTQADFLLYYGDIKEESPLQEFKQSFGEHGNDHRQQLILDPSMTPGQGLATVSVDARPLLEESVLLDIGEMKEAIDEHGNHKTLRSLRDSIKRSFPIDLPDVEPAKKLWYKVREECLDYMICQDPLPGNIFAKTQWPNIKSKEMDRFQRINVFGTSKDINPATNLKKGLPQDTTFKWDRFFQRLALDYQKDDLKLKRVILRIIAWTYQYDYKCLNEIDMDVMRGLEKKVSEGTTVPIQAFSLCANALSKDNQEKFIILFDKWSLQCLEKYKKEYDIYLNGTENGRRRSIYWGYSPYRLKPKVQGLLHWLRALSSILMYNNNILQDVNTKLCLSCVSRLVDFIRTYKDVDINSKSSGMQLNYSLLCLLFFLRRRKFDVDFLQNHDLTNERVRMELNKLCDELQHLDFSILNCYRDMAKELQKYLNGEGTLDGIPIQRMAEAEKDSSSSSKDDE